MGTYLHLFTLIECDENSFKAQIIAPFVTFIEFNRKMDERFLFSILITICVVTDVLCLECYVCDNQDGNTDKCLNTIKTCEQEDDRCLSIIRWSTTPYWSQGAEKQYYVSKMCSSEANCKKEIRATMPLCHYIWYEDWKCAECCQGDRCNYYITLGSQSLQTTKLLYIAPMLIYLFVNNFIVR